MKNNTIYIIAALVVLAIVAVFVFRKKDNSNTNTAPSYTGGATDLLPAYNLGGATYNGVLKAPTESFGSWYNRRVAAGWSFDTKLI